MNFDKIKKNKRLILIGVIALCVIIIGSVYYSNVVSAAKRYDEAVSAYENNKYDEARETFLKLGDYKDSSELAEKCNSSKLEYDLKRAVEYYDNEEYEKAIEILENMENYNGSKELCQQCYALMEVRDNNKKLDPAYSSYYKIVKNKAEIFGKSKLAKDNMSGIKNAYTVKGINLLKLIDFNNDGIDELFVGVRESASYDSGSYEIYAFVNGSAQIIADGDYTLCGGEDGFYGFEIYSDGNGYQLYKGSNDKGKLRVFNGIKFEDGMIWERDGKKCYINDRKVSREEYTTTVPGYYVNAFYPDSDYPLDSYSLSSNQIIVYATNRLAEGMAMNLVTDNNAVYDQLKEAYKRNK